MTTNLRRLLSQSAVPLAFATLLAGCASPSVGELPLLQETVTARCPATAIKECRVWGGNKFRKRYEYCGCRETTR